MLDEAGRTTGKRKAVSCMDCDLPYKHFKMDMVLPRAQWLRIHPEDGGVLCANCIVKRASRLPGATVIHAVIEIYRK